MGGTLRVNGRIKANQAIPSSVGKVVNARLKTVLFPLVVPEPVQILSNIHLQSSKTKKIQSKACRKMPGFDWTATLLTQYKSDPDPAASPQCSAIQWPFSTL